MEKIRYSQEAIKKPKKQNSIKYNYIWQGSIPDSWNKIISKRNFIKVNINKRNRNTLEFLEETQKYISKICPPLKPDEIEIVPSSLKSQESTKKLLELLSKSPILTPKKLSPLGKNSLEKPIRKIKFINTQFRIKSTKSYAASPVFNSFNESPKALSMIRKQVTPKKQIKIRIKLS